MGSSYCDLNLNRLSSKKEKMKCFIVLASLAMASAAPQFYIADTPEVQAAKAQFAAAWNAAAQRNAVAPVPVAAPVAPVAAAAPVATAGLYEDGQTWPEAEPYVHEEIAAEPYVHIEPAHVAVAPVAPAAPVVQAAAPVQYANYAPVQPVAPVAPVAAGCFNWKGESVPCRY